MQLQIGTLIYTAVRDDAEHTPHSSFPLLRVVAVKARLCDRRR